MSDHVLEKQVYYVLKIKGKAKIPDYLQIRDENFTLIGYIRPDREEKIRKSFDNEKVAEAIVKVMDQLPYGKLEKLEI